MGQDIKHLGQGIEHQQEIIADMSETATQMVQETKNQQEMIAGVNETANDAARIIEGVQENSTSLRGTESTSEFIPVSCPSRNNSWKSNYIRNWKRYWGLY